MQWYYQSMICRVCNIDKPESDFSPKNNGKLNTRCKECSNEYARRHYRENKNFRERRKACVAAYNRRSYVERQKKLEALKDKPCADCGVWYPPCVMEFHHLDPSNKTIEVPLLMNTRCRWERVLEEVDKCVLLCANCHRIRHHIHD
jgi:hypothetical protein